MISSRILFTKSLGYFLRRRCFLNMRIVLVKVGACVLERKNLMASPFEMISCLSSKYNNKL